jgi:hypothetical protein
MKIVYLIAATAYLVFMTNIPQDLRGVYAVEWSATAKNFHIQPLSETLRLGAISYLEGRPSDYILVALGSNALEAQKIMLEMESEKGG